MDKNEIYSDLRTIPPVFVRVDGRGFHRLAEELRLERPLDPRFCRAMTKVCREFLTGSGLAPRFAYTFSDEISLYFTALPFDGRVEKLVSVCASYAASSLTLALGCTGAIAFDARIIPVPGPLFRQYLHARQADAWRNHVNATCQDTLMREGMSAAEAAAFLRGRTSPQLHELMFARGVNLAKAPAWQRRGVLVCRDGEEKKGFNPLTGREVVAERHVVREITVLPLFSAPGGIALLDSLQGQT
jgi:tRNA(His) 5'-end guanylyltransferase